MSTPEADLQNSDEGVTVRDTSISVTNDGSDTLFGRYRTLRELGRGGMGLVVLAQDTVLGVPVALKLVPEIVARDSEGIGDLKKEVLRGMELAHPNIVRVFSFEQDAKSAVIVMEHVQGESLGQKKLHRANRCFDCDEVFPWLEQLCSALDYAHQEARIAHRDLKPGNLLLTPAGRLKVVDFGIASSLSETMSRVSVRKDTAGTPPYMSPQQAMGERPTHLDDIYSLGATVFELLTGKPPFFRGNILAQVMHEDPIPMSQRREELGVSNCAPIPEAWEKMVAACLSKSPEARPQSGSAALAMLTNPGRALVVSPPQTLSDLKLEPAPTREVVPVYAPPAPKAPPREPKTAKLVSRGGNVNVRKVGHACAALVQGTFSLIGTVLRPFLILALIIVAIWGVLFLKHRWDENQIKQDEAAAKAAAAKAAQVAAATPAPNPQVIYLPPPPPGPLDRGRGPALEGSSLDGRGLRPQPPKR